MQANHRKTEASLPVSLPAREGGVRDLPAACLRDELHLCWQPCPVPRAEGARAQGEGGKAQLPVRARQPRHLRHGVQHHLHPDQVQQILLCIHTSVDAGIICKGP